ncbi:MAG TPA: cytochrome P450 [Candidatus Dormibacteraeota bacterium]|nr:cytochrome P450 [Candidatus Dormibacteraeota bacterium]
MQRSGPSSMIPINPFDKRARPDPYPVYQYMRTVEPIHRSQVGYWILTRYDDCRAVLEDPRWSHDADRILEPTRRESDAVDPTVRLLRASIAFSDPPKHAQHRRPLEASIKTALRAKAPRVKTVAEGLVTLMREKGAGADLIRDYATPLPVVILTDLLGIPATDRVQVQRWGRELASGLDPAIRAQGIVRAGAAATAMVEYMLERIEAARRVPDASLISQLASKPTKLTTWELIADLTVFLVTGIETATGLIGNALLAILRNQGELERIRAEPELLDTGLDELIRFDGPLHLTARVATENIEVAGVKIAQGEQVLALLAAANRDPARFKEPDRLDLARSDNPHLGFGAGTHKCFAEPLAKLLCRAAITTLLEELDGLALDGDPQWNDTVTLRGLSRLPVTFNP